MQDSLFTSLITRFHISDDWRVVWSFTKKRKNLLLGTAESVVLFWAGKLAKSMKLHGFLWSSMSRKERRKRVGFLRCCMHDPEQQESCRSRIRLRETSCRLIWLSPSIISPCGQPASSIMPRSSVIFSHCGTHASAKQNEQASNHLTETKKAWSDQQ